MNRSSLSKGTKFNIKNPDRGCTTDPELVLVELESVDGSELKVFNGDKNFSIRQEDIISIQSPKK